MSIRDGFNQVLDKYLIAKNNPQDRTTRNAVYNDLQTLVSRFQQLSSVTNYHNLMVKCTRGIGSMANVPWIAFLDPRITDTTQRGVYVVYLIKANMEGIYLTYNQGIGVTGSAKPTSADLARVEANAKRLRKDVPWLTNHGFLLDDKISLEDMGSTGKGYERSTIAYKYYARSTIPPDNELNQDLEFILQAYKQYADSQTSPLTSPSAPSATSATQQSSSEQSLIDIIIQYIRAQGFTFTDNLIKNFYISMKTKPFILLVGISGIGKTALTQLFAEAISARYQRIAVRADWSDDSDLIGYYNPLLQTYHQTPFLKFLLEARNESDKIHIVCLDEMNLARVEYYFAGFLSAMETKNRVLNLHEESQLTIPKEITIPENLFFIGTVNMDETTYAFSPKVLDRANTIEITDIEITNISNPQAGASVYNLSMKELNNYRKTALQLSQLPNNGKSFLEALKEIFNKIKCKNLRFGYRVRNEILRYLINSLEIFDTNPDINLRIAFDIQIKQKILPKLSGSGDELRDSLQTLKEYFEKEQLE